MLLIGPPGSGRTSYVLDRVERAIRQGSDFQLITPTASMARHLQHELARRGLVVPTDSIETIARLVERLTPDMRSPSPAVQDALIKQAIDEAGREEFRSVQRTPGLRSKLLQSIAELEAADCSAERLRPLCMSPTQHAFQRVFQLYEEKLAHHGLTSAGKRLFSAAVQCRDRKGAVGCIYFDGFFHLAEGEARLVKELSSLAEVVVSLPEGREPASLAEFEVERLAEVRRTQPRTTVVVASSIEQEVEDIARRIIQQRRPLREIGVILRSPDAYATTIQAVFERFGIPFRLRRDTPLRQHPAIAVVRDLAWAIARGLPGAETLAALTRPASPFARPETDAYDFRVRQRLPGQGAEFFKKDAPGRVADFIDELAGREVWSDEAASANAWSRRIGDLARMLSRTAAADPATTPQRALELRGYAEARQSLGAALEEAAQLCDLAGETSITLSQYLERLDSVLALTPARTRDERRDVVNVLSVFEARQWELPVVFVCGMVEGQFPANETPNLFFSDIDRKRFLGNGIRLRTSDEKAEDEKFLFKIATTRATEELWLTYPELDASGAPLLRSFFLPPASEGDLTAISSKPNEHGAGFSSNRSLPVAAQIRDESLVRQISERNRRFSPSSIEDYLQCPFMFFSKRTLRLQERPADPDGRLDALLKGTIVHRAILDWSRSGFQSIGEILDNVFDEELRRTRQTKRFRTELARTSMKADLERFERDNSAKTLPRTSSADYEYEFEYIVEAEGPAGYAIRGRIDRFETIDEQWAIVVDYKYSSASRVGQLCRQHREGAKVQAPLYLSALSRQFNLRPAGMLFWGLRGETSMGGWVSDRPDFTPATPKLVKQVSDDELTQMIDDAERTAAASVAEVRRGEIRVDPRDRGHCKRFCEYRDLCRIKL